MHKELYKGIKKDNNVTLTGEKIDIFFHGNVLKRYLNYPLWNERDLLIRVYENFKSHFAKDCVYKVANFQRLGQAFFANILFFTNQQHKYMLSMFYSHNYNINDQRVIINEILNELCPLEISNIALPDEDLQEPIHELIKDLLSRRIDPNELRLKKVRGRTTDNQEISFHELQYLIDKEKRTGISIVAGFQY